MHAALRAFLAGLVDYAGLFPPARLALPDALAEYDRHRESARAWALGPFILPVTDLGALAEQVTTAYRQFAPMPTAVLGGGGDDAAGIVRALHEDFLAADLLLQKSDGGAEATGFERRLPAAIAADRAAAEDLAAVAEEHRPRTVGRCFLEVVRPTDPDEDTAWRRSVESALDAWEGHDAVGFKLRCGGLTPADVPALEQVAFALDAARQARVPVKATAGLHHPLRGMDHTGSGDATVPMHGFLNVFGAGVLAHARGLSAADLVPVLKSRDPSAFTFDDDGFAWRDYRATTEEVERARGEAVISYGSCSFAEPIEDLEALGFLEREEE